MASIHDVLFQLPPRQPFRFGTGPFRCRGSVYRDDRALTEKLLAPRGLTVAELVKRQNDPAFEAFFAQPRFNASDWYDVQPLLYMDALVARARGVPHLQHVRDAALMHAQNALGGFTSVVLRLVSNESVATWLPRISGWYHDFGHVESKVVGEGRVRSIRYGMPAIYVQAWSVTAVHFCEFVLARAGAKEPRATVLEALPDGVREGHPLYRITMDMSWGV
jgi:hypothetical protein